MTQQHDGGRDLVAAARMAAQSRWVIDENTNSTQTQSLLADMADEIERLTKLIDDAGKPWLALLLERQIKWEDGGIDGVVEAACDSIRLLFSERDEARAERDAARSARDDCCPDPDLSPADLIRRQWKFLNEYAREDEPHARLLAAAKANPFTKGTHPLLDHDAIFWQSKTGGGVLLTLPESDWLDALASAVQECER